MKIKVKEIIQSNCATSGDDALKIREIIESNIDEKIIVDFKGINLVNSAFLRKSIGELFKNKKNAEKLDKNLSVINLDEDDLELLNKKIILLYKNYEKVKKSQKEFFDEIKD